MKKCYLLLLLITFSGCDVYYHYQLTIENKTVDTIRIYLTGASAKIYSLDSILVMPNSKNMFYNQSGRKVSNFECDPYINDGNYNVSISGNKNLKKNITQKEYWNCLTDDNAGIYSLTFVINQSDLE